jgi:hypothetical protein
MREEKFLDFMTASPFSDSVTLPDGWWMAACGSTADGDARVEFSSRTALGAAAANRPHMAEGYFPLHTPVKRNPRSSNWLQFFPKHS